MGALGVTSQLNAPPGRMDFRRCLLFILWDH
jgi:hypothetical protein